MYVAVNLVDGNTVVGPFDGEQDFMGWHHAFSALLSNDDVARERSSWQVLEVEHRAEDPHDSVKPAISELGYFGLGRFEGIRYEQWLDGAVRFSGTVYVACGYGNEHYPELNTGVVQANDWEALLLAHIRDRMRNRHGANFLFKDAQFSVAAELLDEVLGEEWSDPCDVEEDVNEAGEQPAPLQAEEVVTQINEAIYEAMNNKGDLGEALLAAIEAMIDRYREPA